MGTPAKQIGIYKITSPSGKVYIGQSWDVAARFRKYKSISSIKKQRILYNSILKYGYINHKIEIVELFSEGVTQEELDNAEIFYIKKFKDEGFNLLNIREGGLGGKLPKDSIEKMLITRGKWNHTEESKRKISINHFGILHTEETKRKMSVTRKGKGPSLETIEKIKQSRKINKSGTKIILNLETGIFYQGAEEAANAYNLSRNYLHKMLIGYRTNKTNLKYV